MPRVPAERSAWQDYTKSIDDYVFILYPERMKKMYIYIITNRKYGVPYIGVTNNLVRRIWEHKNKQIKGFTSRYNLHKLVYFEVYDDEITAITREKKLKNYSRQKKIDLINTFNPSWRDLYEDICK